MREDADLKHQALAKELADLGAQHDERGHKQRIHHERRANRGSGRIKIVGDRPDRNRQGVDVKPHLQLRQNDDNEWQPRSSDDSGCAGG